MTTGVEITVVARVLIEVQAEAVAGDDLEIRRKLSKDASLKEAAWRGLDRRLQDRGAADAGESLAEASVFQDWEAIEAADLAEDAAATEDSLIAVVGTGDAEPATVEGLDETKALPPKSASLIVAAEGEVERPTDDA